jgi:hypothetical protein
VANITAAGNTTFCAGDSLQLFASSGVGYSYQWRINGSDIPAAIHSVYMAKNSGQYSVLISNASGCSALSNTIGVTVKPSPDASLSADGSTTLCEGQSVHLSVPVAAGLSYKWMKNGTEISGESGAFYTVTESGIYTAIVSNAECTSFSEAMQVIVNPNPQVDLGADSTLCGHYSIVLEAGLGFDTYLWSDGSTAPTLLVDSSGIGYSTQSFSVTVAKNNCQGSDLINISFKPCTGIDEQFGMEQFLVYPNPSKDVFIFEMTKYQDKKLIIRVLNTQGQIILQRDLLVQKEQIQEEIDLSRESKGVYILQLINDKEARNLKLIRN